MTESAAPLKWSSQFSVARSNAISLQGDKITLPPSALEQLLEAATVVVAGQDELYQSPWGVGGGPMRILDRKQDLPHPLTFRLVSPDSGNVVYAGIRQFTAEDGEIGLSKFLERVLDLKNEGDAARVTVHVQELPKGTYVKLRPLEAGYDADWKPLLERYLRTSFTTLTRGIELDVPSGDGKEYKFLVDELKPEGSQAVCIVDTDLEVDIEALNEEQARETIKRKSEKEKSGGMILFGEVVQGQVTEGVYVDYTLSTWDRTKDIAIELNSEGEVDLLLSPLSPNQRSQPREDEHVIHAIEGSPRRIELRSTNIELERAEQLFISAHGFEAASFSLKVDLLTKNTSQTISTTTQAGPDEVICKNCHQKVPKRTLVLHESFCYRNNVSCPKCHQVFQKSSPLWSFHWHCPHDSAHGNTELSQRKHNHLLHTSRTCPGCGYLHTSILSLAQHRTTTCPAKLILCQFCHLLVPQQGPDDPDPNSAEVLLSGLTPHELSDGARTTECHLCGKFIRLRDMSVHMRHHDLERKARPTPKLCGNVNCGRIMRTSSSDETNLGLCQPCFGPLYATGYDPEFKALKRRVERRYLTQFLSGCAQDWCRNEYCKTAREYLGLPVVTSKEGLVMVKDQIEGVGKLNMHETWRFCVDSEDVQKRRTLGEMIAKQNESTGSGYDLGWWIAALETNGNDITKARSWLIDWGRRKDE